MPVSDSHCEILSSDRRVDWNPGISGSIAAYPNGKNAITDFGADNKGIADSTTAIQKCLNVTSSGKACYLPPGPYRTTKSISIPSGVVLRGAGPGLTTIHVDTSGTNHGIIVGSGSVDWFGTFKTLPSRGESKIDVNWRSGSNYVNKIVAGSLISIRHNGTFIASGSYTGPNGSATLVDSTKSWTNDSLIGYIVKNLRNLRQPEIIGTITGNTSNTVTAALSGGYLWNTNDKYFIYPDGNPYWVHDHGYNGFPTSGANRGQEAQLFKVTKVDVIVPNVSARLTLDKPIYVTYTNVLSPVVNKCYNNVVRNSDIEDLQIVYLNNNPGAYNISISTAMYSWIKNVESYNVVRSHVWCSDTLGIEIRDSYFHHQNKNNYKSNSGYGVIFYNNNSDALVENNIFYSLRHAVMFSNGGLGCVVGYNYGEGFYDNYYPHDNTLTLALATHGTQPIHTLFEGNISGKMGMDNVWGGSKYITFFRNWARRFQVRTDKEQVVTGGLYAFQVDAHNLFANFIGNIMGRPGDTGNIWTIGCNNAWACVWRDANVNDSMLRHGNYDYVSNTIQWDSNIADHNIPKSLYHNSKPSFLKDDDLWPPIGPDVSGYAHTIPALRRFNSLRPQELLQIQ